MPPCKWQEGALTEYKYASNNGASCRLACSHPHSSVKAFVPVITVPVYCLTI